MHIKILEQRGVLYGAFGSYQKNVDGSDFFVRNSVITPVYKQNFVKNIRNRCAIIFYL